MELLQNNNDENNDGKSKSKSENERTEEVSEANGADEKMITVS